MKPKAPASAKQIDDDLALGMKHLAEANMALLRQRRLIFRLSAKGEPTFDAEALFADMLQTLRIMSERLMVLEIAGDVSNSPLGPNVTKPTTTTVEKPLAMRLKSATHSVR
jgi:hypothetical protein